MVHFRTINKFVHAYEGNKWLETVGRAEQPPEKLLFIKKRLQQKVDLEKEYKQIDKGLDSMQVQKCKDHQLLRKWYNNLKEGRL